MCLGGFHGAFLVPPQAGDAAGKLEQVRWDIPGRTGKQESRFLGPASAFSSCHQPSTVADT